MLSSNGILINPAAIQYLQKHIINQFMPIILLSNNSLLLQQILPCHDEQTFINNTTCTITLNKIKTQFKQINVLFISINNWNDLNQTLIKQLLNITIIFSNIVIYHLQDSISTNHFIKLASNLKQISNQHTLLFAIQQYNNINNYIYSNTHYIQAIINQLPTHIIHNIRNTFNHINTFNLGQLQQLTTKSKIISSFKQLIIQSANKYTPISTQQFINQLLTINIKSSKPTSNHTMQLQNNIIDNQHLSKYQSFIKIQYQNIIKQLPLPLELILFKLDNRHKLFTNHHSLASKQNQKIFKDYFQTIKIQLISKNQSKIQSYTKQSFNNFIITQMLQYQLDLQKIQCKIQSFLSSIKNSFSFIQQTHIQKQQKYFWKLYSKSILQRFNYQSNCRIALENKLKIIQSQCQFKEKEKQQLKVKIKQLNQQLQKLNAYSQSLKLNIQKFNNQQLSHFQQMKNKQKQIKKVLIDNSQKIKQSFKQKNLYFINKQQMDTFNQLKQINQNLKNKIQLLQKNVSYQQVYQKRQQYIEQKNSNLIVQQNQILNIKNKQTNELKKNINKLTLQNKNQKEQINKLKLLLEDKLKSIQFLQKVVNDKEQIIDSLREEIKSKTEKFYLDLQKTQKCYLINDNLYEKKVQILEKNNKQLQIISDNSIRDAKKYQSQLSSIKLIYQVNNQELKKSYQSKIRQLQNINQQSLKICCQSQIQYQNIINNKEHQISDLNREIKCLNYKIQQSKKKQIQNQSKQILLNKQIFELKLQNQSIKSQFQRKLQLLNQKNCYLQQKLKKIQTDIKSRQELFNSILKQLSVQSLSSNFQQKQFTYAKMVKKEQQQIGKLTTKRFLSTSTNQRKKKENILQQIPYISNKNSKKLGFCLDFQ